MTAKMQVCQHSGYGGPVANQALCRQCRGCWFSKPGLAATLLLDASSLAHQAFGETGEPRSSFLGSLPDSKLLAVGGGMYEQSGEVKIFDLATGAERASFPDHKEWVECVTFSADGHWLASGGGFSRELPGEIRVWDAKRLVAKGE